jgi:hypothetical protein
VRQIEFLTLATQILERLGARYAVVGSYASSAWGEPRMTRDIDIVVELTVDQLNALCEAFPPRDFYVSRVAALEALNHHTQFNVIHPTSGNKIDFMMAGVGEWAKEQFDRRLFIEFEPTVSGYVAAPEDVILGKLIYYREGRSEKHLRDIRGILKVSKDNLDLQYIDRHAAKLGLNDIWESLSAERLDD